MLTAEAKKKLLEIAEVFVDQACNACSEFVDGLHEAAMEDKKIAEGEKTDEK